MLRFSGLSRRIIRQSKFIPFSYRRVRFYSTPSNSEASNANTIIQQDLIQPNTETEVPVSTITDLSNYTNQGLEAVGDGTFLEKLTGPFSAFAEKTITSFHNFTGLPWWVCIVIISAMMRFATTPFYIISLKNNMKMAKISPELRSLIRKQQEHMYKKTPEDRELALRYRERYKQVMKENGVSQFKPLLASLVQMPIFLSFFFGIQRLARHVDSMKYGGIAWFQDLTIADPSYALPVISALCMIASFEFGASLNPAMKRGSIMKWIVRGMALITIPILGRMPAAVFMYWITNNAVNMCIMGSLRFQPVRQLLRLPDPSEISSNPQQEIMKLFKKAEKKKAPEPVRLYTQQELHKLRKARK